MYLRMNVTVINNQIIGMAQMRIKAMMMGTKFAAWAQTLNNNELEFLYADAGNIFTHYGVAANLLQRLVSADIGSLEAFAVAISGNAALYMYFTELTYGI